MATSANQETQNLEGLKAHGIQAQKTYIIGNQYYYQGYVYDWDKFKAYNSKLEGVHNTSSLSFTFDYEVGYIQKLELRTLNLGASDESLRADTVIEHLMNVLADYSHAN